MPTYEYRCTRCGFEFEEFQSIAAEPISICPKCGAAGVQRKISGGSGLIFKGSGFYITDYKKNGAQPESTNAGKKSKSNDLKKTKKSED
jgi:putative FmdB family regulatory protein